jgi:hypothetical protein
MVDALIEEHPEFTAVRGYYHCPLWGKQQHWWCVDKKGNIIDPTVRQFPTKGAGAEYEPFNGMVECSECGTEKPEVEMEFNGQYAFCSYKCQGKFLGIL